MKNYTLIMAMLLLSGCTSGWDMQGENPKEYYAEHPVKNKVETREQSFVAHFQPKQTRLDADETDNLQLALRDITPVAVDKVSIILSDADKYNDIRKEAITRTLRSLGYVSPKYNYASSPDVMNDEVRITMIYLAIVPPDCPDWRMSPVTTYSNAHHEGFRCSVEVDSGLMIADPHDLVRGTGDVQPDTERASKVINDYNSGKNYMPSTQSAGGSTSGSGGGSSSSSSSTSGSSTSAAPAAPAAAP